LAATLNWLTLVHWRTVRGSWIAEVRLIRRRVRQLW